MSTLHLQRLAEASNKSKDQQGELAMQAGAQILLWIHHKKLKQDFDKTSKIATARLEKTKTKDQQIATYRDDYDVLKEETGAFCNPW